MALASRLGFVCRGLGLRPAHVSVVLPLMPRMSLATRAAPQAPQKNWEADNEEEEYDPLDGLNVAAKRRVMALKEVQEKYDVTNQEYQKELAQLQAKYNTLYGPLFDDRASIVSGKKAVGKYEYEEEDQDPDTGIPEFWLTALANHDRIGPFVTDRDAEVLKYLVDIRQEVLVGEDRGFKLVFHFSENPHFSNKTLEKTYILEPEEDVIPKRFVGCKIEWKKGMDVTVEQHKKRVKGAAKGDKAKAFVMEERPCDSFFNIFDPPQIPENPDALADEEMDELQEELTVDFDIGFAIKDNVIPRAVEWFTGEIAPLADEEYEDEEYEEFEEEPAPPPPARKQGGGGGGGRR